MFGVITVVLLVSIILIAVAGSGTCQEACRIGRCPRRPVKTIRRLATASG
jgi:hypothetical protein